MKTLKELKENKEEITEKGPGLWANIRAKRQRIKSGSGERMRKPGEKGAPSPDALQKAKGTSEDVAEGSGKNVVKSVKVGNFRHDLVDTGMGWQVRIYNGDELYDTGMSKNSKQKGLAALEDAVAYTEKQTRTKRQGVAEAAFKDPSPMMKDSIKQDKIRSLKNLIAIAKVKGVHHKVKELELELKKLQEVTEASKPRTPMRDFLRRYPVPKDQVAKPVKKEKPPEKKVEEQHPEDMKIPSNKLEPEGTKKWLAIHGKHLKYLKNLKKAPAYEEKEVNEAEGSGTEIPKMKQAADSKKRAQLAVKAAELKLKQERERSALQRMRKALRSEEKVPEFKSGGKPLAKKFDKAMAAMGIKTKTKIRTTNNISMNELFTEAMKKEKEKAAPTSKDKIKKGEALSGKKEPVEVSPEMSPTK